MSKKNVPYEDFVNKFKPKHTTDDCYTPPKVYDAVLEWARQYLGIGSRTVVRPFYPGGDYEHYDYPDNCVVVDNPPFSIFAKIVDFYQEQGIDFLLFAPGMSSIRKNCTYIGVGVSVTYENGAVVNTSFVSNMMGDLVCTTAPRLAEAVRKANCETQRQSKKSIRKLSFPDCVLRATELHTITRAGILYQVDSQEARVVSQACRNGSEFGNSVLLSSRATAEKLAAKKLAAEKLAAEKLAAEKLAAEKLAAEKLAAERLVLSDKSLAILKELNSHY